MEGVHIKHCLELYVSHSQHHKDDYDAKPEVLK